MRQFFRNENKLWVVLAILELDVSGKEVGVGYCVRAEDVRAAAVSYVVHRNRLFP